MRMRRGASQPVRRRPGELLQLGALCDIRTEARGWDRQARPVRLIAMYYKCRRRLVLGQAICLAVVAYHAPRVRRIVLEHHVPPLRLGPLQ